MQRIMNVLFLNTEYNGKCTADMIDDAITYIIDLNYEHYETLYSQLSEKQRRVFIAIAMEGHAKNISGSKFIHKYNLSSSSSVISAVRGLLEKDVISHENGVYYIYDLFFQIWLMKTELTNIH